jgi:hypothetical protein
MTQLDLTGALLALYAQERSELLTTLRYIAGHAGMAQLHANDTGCRASLKNVKQAALKAIAVMEGGAR